MKVKYGNINLVESDIRFEGKQLTRTLVLGFVGGWVAGALGLGGGAIFNPALLTMGLPPQVSSATGLYLVTFSKIASCLVYLLNGELDLPYSFWLGAWATFGSVIGMWLTNLYMRMSGRQSIIVWVLVFMFAISVIAIPVLGGLSIKQEMDLGKDIYKFSTICEK